jgi:hypothetical protein
MSDTEKRVRESVEDARSTDDLVSDGPWSVGEIEPLDSPLDRETLDEQASTQMGPWEPRRRDAN